MNWTEITVKVAEKDTESAAAIANMTVPYGIYIEDYSDLEQKAEEIAHINLIDEELLAKDRETSLIHVYIAETDNALEAVEFLKERLRAADIGFEVTSIGVDDSDWNENWKKFFHAAEIGNKLAIVPSWETYDNKQNRVLLHIDPGAAFGTGTHATTSLCLKLLENYVKNDTKVLDIGCGSGILAIASVLLGAEKAVGVDIDAQSVKTAKENAEINKISEKCEFINGDLAEKVTGKYNVVCANIVADVIIPLAEDVRRYLKDGGTFIASGIIEMRIDEVKAAIEENGFEIQEIKKENDWYCIISK